METVASIRIDKWLWAARAFKTRSLASDACDGGKGILKVIALSERRGAAPVARTLYEDLTPPAPPRARQAKPPYREPGAGRPTKRERREIDRLRGW